MPILRQDEIPARPRDAKPADKASRYRAAVERSVPPAAIRHRPRNDLAAGFARSLSKSARGTPMRALALFATSPRINGSWTRPIVSASFCANCIFAPSESRSDDAGFPFDPPIEKISRTPTQVFRIPPGPGSEPSNQDLRQPAFPRRGRRDCFGATRPGTAPPLFARPRRRRNKGLLR